MDLSTADIISRLRALHTRPVGEFSAGVVPADFRRASVLLLCWPEADSARIVLTERAHHLSEHSGQVSFPGGRIQAEDADSKAAALRETEEELGIPASSIEVVGRLDDSWSVARHHVVPWVGVLPARPAMHVDPGEVARAIVADLPTLSSGSGSYVRQLTLDGMVFDDTVFPLPGDANAWGMTSDILLELIRWLRREPSRRVDMREAELRAIGDIRFDSNAKHGPRTPP